MVPGIDPRGRDTEESQDGHVLREPFERLASQEGSVLLVPGRHRRSQIRVLGGEGLRHALHVDARRLALRLLGDLGAGTRLAAVG